jgi:hypothetical protein
MAMFRRDLEPGQSPELVGDGLPAPASRGPRLRRRVREGLCVRG